jgi:protein-S-isoprenylcysteine O-methyltransferase Ste14
MREPVVASGHQRAGPAAEQAVLLVYAAAFLAITFFLVHWIEDPALARRLGQQFEDYRNQVPGWWPRLPR